LNDIRRQTPAELVSKKKVFWLLFMLRNKYLLVDDFIIHGKCKSLNDICACSKKLAMNLADWNE